jgi:hypothetical protein
MKSRITLKLKDLCLRAIGGDAANAERDSLPQSERTPLSYTDAPQKNLQEEVTWVKEKIDRQHQQICEHEGHPIVLSLYGVTLEELNNEDLIKLCKIFHYHASKQRVHMFV